MHNNALELLAVSLALKTFVKHKSHVNVLIQMDNILAKAYINHFGITLPSTELNCSPTVEMMPGLTHFPNGRASSRQEQSQVVDEESRAVRDHCHWMIHLRLFAQIPYSAKF